MSLTRPPPILEELSNNTNKHATYQPFLLINHLMS